MFHWYCWSYLNRTHDLLLRRHPIQPPDQHHRRFFSSSKSLIFYSMLLHISFVSLLVLPSYPFCSCLSGMPITSRLGAWVCKRFVIEDSFRSRDESKTDNRSGHRKKKQGAIFIHKNEIEKEKNRREWMKMKKRNKREWMKMKSRN